MKEKIKNILRSKKFIIPVVCVLVFGFAGSVIGIAGFGGAIAGTIPFAVIGAVLGVAYVNGFRVKKVMR